VECQEWLGTLKERAAGKSKRGWKGATLLHENRRRGKCGKAITKGEGGGGAANEKRGDHKNETSLD